MKKFLPLVMLLASVSLSVPAMAEPVAPAAEKEIVKEHKGKKGKKHHGHKGKKGEKVTKNQQMQHRQPMPKPTTQAKPGKVWMPSMSRGFQK